MLNVAQWFVNREKQFNGFLKMVARETPKCIMLVTAEADMGKTWLIETIRRHCDQHTIPNLHIDFRDRLPYDYLSLVRQARDQLGGPLFNPLTATINELTAVEVALQAPPPTDGVTIHVEGGSLTVAGDVAGGHIIKDNTFHIVADSEMTRRAAEIKINDAFFACLVAFQATQPVVFLFDSYEEATEDADAWIRHYLFTQLSEQRLPQVIVIIAGREGLPEPTAGVAPLVASTGLDLFSEEYVREYIEVKRQITGLDIVTVFRTSRGFPGLLAKLADLASVDTSHSDDSWL